MADYRVGVAVSRKSEQQVTWLETHRPDLQPTRVLGGAEDHVRLVLNIAALSEADAIARISMLFDQAARGSGGAIFGSESGPIEVRAWKVGDDPPAHYRAAAS